MWINYGCRGLFKLCGRVIRCRLTLEERGRGGEYQECAVMVNITK